MGKKSANARVSIVHGEESPNARDSVTSEINWTCMSCYSCKSVAIRKLSFVCICVRELGASNCKKKSREWFVCLDFYIQSFTSVVKNLGPLT
jgi:hypothetical protein